MDNDARRYSSTISMRCIWIVDEYRRASLSIQIIRTTHYFVCSHESKLYIGIVHLSASRLVDFSSTAGWTAVVYPTNATACPRPMMRRSSAQHGKLQKSWPLPVASRYVQLDTCLQTFFLCSRPGCWRNRCHRPGSQCPLESIIRQFLFTEVFWFFTTQSNLSVRHTLCKYTQ